MKPKIGIRPTIDGRWGGVRESLEEKQWQWQKPQRSLSKRMSDSKRGCLIWNL